MDRSRTTNEHSKTIRRIAAVLFALADLVESASSRSLAVRCLVLWLLRPGEIVARNYLAKLTRHPADRIESTPLAFTTDTMRLATSFRTLAATLLALAAEFLASRPHAIAPRWGDLAAVAFLAAFRSPAIAVERRDSS